MLANKLNGSQCLQLNLSAIGATAQFTSSLDDPTDLLGIPVKYEDFVNIFSKGKVTLAPHQDCNLHISL
jgi:hypothetical protein